MQKKTILLVDDDPFLQCLYRKTLEREGFDMVTANDGLAAIEKIPELTPDLVVLDLMLPKLDGLQVLESIRSDKRHGDLPVLILSNAYLPQVAQKAMKAGATSGILKSECSPKRLVKIIHELLEAAPQKGKENPQAAGKNSWISGLMGRNAENPAPESVKAKVIEDKSPEPAASPEVQNELLNNWQTDLSMIRGICLKYAKSTGSQESETHLKEIYRRLRFLSARSTMAGWSQISEMGSALEAMLFERGFNANKSMSQSAIQTMFQGIDCLEHLLKTGGTTRVKTARETKILLVDDDPVCNCANDLALKRVNFETTCVNDGVAALALLENCTFDLIFLDINMPVLSGLEVCEKLRGLPKCKDIPVIFVTIQDDFKSRAQSVLCGGNGLIIKPISPLELIVKTLIFLLHPKTGKFSKPQPAGGTPTADKNTASSPAQSRPAEPLKMKDPGQEPPRTQTAVEGKVNTPTPVAAGGKEDSKTQTKELAAQTEPPQTDEEQAAACAKRMGEFETALAKAQQEKQNLMKQLEAVGKRELRTKLESALEENQKNQAILLQKLEETWLEFEAQQIAQANAQANAQPMVALSPKVSEVSRTAVEDKVKGLTQALEAETQRCEDVKPQAAAIAEQQTTLEDQLTESNLAQAQLRAQLAEHRQLIDLQTDNLTRRTKEMEASRAAVEAKVKDLTQALAAETKRCESAEKQAATISQQRTKLETELAASNQAQGKLRAQLEEQQQVLDAQVGNLTGQTKQLAASRAAVETKVKDLTQALAAETKRCESAEKQAATISQQRTKLETELAASNEAQAKLRAQLAEQQQVLEAQVGNLTGQTKQLEASRAAVEAKVKDLSQALAAETKRCESAEKQAATISQQRTALETELTASNQTQAKLRTQLAEQQQLLNAQIDNLAGRTKELEASRAAVEAKVKDLTQALATETKRCESAEKQAETTSQQRTALETKLAASNQAQAKLRAQLAEQQQVLEAQIKTHKVELENRKELEASRAAVEEKVKDLTQALAAETKRCENAEKQAANISAQRTALETELAASSKVQAQLHAQLAEQQQLLEAQVQRHNFELENRKELEASRAAVEEKVKDLTQALAAESKRCKSALQQAASISEQRTALEAVLAASNQAQAQLSAQLAEQQQLLAAQVHAHKVELKNRKELEASRAAVEEKVKDLTQALAAETKRCESAEQQVTNVDGQRKALEAELAASNQAQAQLSAQLAEQQQLVTLAVAELEDLRQCAAVEASRLEQMAGKAAESEKARADLDHQLNDVRALLSTREAAIRELELELQQRRETQERLDKSLQDEVEHRRRIEVQLEHVQAQLAETAGQLAQKCAAEQAWLERESTLQSSLRSQQDELAQSGAKLGRQEAELENARKQIEELQARQSALCAKVQELGEAGESAAKVIEESKARIARTEHEVGHSHKELAGLRYAILDASRMSVKLRRERSQQEQQNLEATRQLLLLLAQTPLSLAQRGMLADIQNAMDAQKNQLATTAQTALYPIEMPGFQSSQFCFSEMIESACGAVRVAAETAGVAVQVSTSGTTSGNVIGYAEHVHQLITLLAISPLTMMAGINALDLRVEITPRDVKFAEMNLRIALATDNNAQDLLAHLTSVTAAAPSLQAASLNEAEFGVAAGWQLALAIGAQVSLELEGSKAACLVLSLPLELDLDSSVDKAAAEAPSSNGHGSRNGHRNHSRNGDGHPLNGTGTSKSPKPRHLAKTVAVG